MSTLIYEDKAAYDTWLKVVLMAVLAIPTMLAISRIVRNAEEGLTGFGILLFITILFRIILPRRFHVYDDKLRILLGGESFAFNIFPSDIREVNLPKGIKAFLYTRLRFVTSANHTIETDRRN